MTGSSSPPPRLSPMAQQYLELLARPVRFAPGMGPKRAEAIAELGVRTLGDLLLLLPRRYEDRRNLVPIANLPFGVPTCVQGHVLHVSTRRPRSNRRGVRSIVEALVGDETGRLKAIWFNQPYRAEKLQVGRQVVLYGSVELRGRMLQMNSPDVSTLDGGEFIPSILPIYPLVQGFSQRVMQQLIHGALELISPLIVDPVPEGFLHKHDLPSLREALLVVHQPERVLTRLRAGAAEDAQWQEQVERARRRLAYDELFVLECLLARRRTVAARKATGAVAVGSAPDSLPAQFARALPFRYTAAQERVLAEILTDMARERPMNRLLQGDVGSGKTVVMLHAMLTAVQAGYQAVLMAPTELLAEQHFRTVQRFLGHLPVRTSLLVSGASRAEREETFWSAPPGEADIVVGTHALFQEGVQFRKVGLVVIDEQHKFGVQQRAQLLAKGSNPHVLVTSATPIPRSLALTLYGDLDVSILDELPPGRGKVITRWTFESKIDLVYTWLDEQFNAGRQAYLVCPVIDPSEALDHLQPASVIYESLRARFATRQVGLVHGRLRSHERQETLAAFARGELDLLIATTVIEVGVDIPNATIMVILNAERYGMAQLHQLRGRVGRGSATSYCVLVTSPQVSDDGRQRMQALVETTDGFEIAERDLALRGPGELLGTRQHGAMLFRVADLPKDEPVLLKARRDAYQLIGEDPTLERPEHGLLRALVESTDTGLLNVR